MKRPPVQYTDEEAERQFTEFAQGDSRNTVPHRTPVDMKHQR